VVPFSPAAGLLEWVEDTEPLGTYLTGKDRTSGAHARYARPGDYSFFDAYNVISKCKPQNLRKAYDDVSLSVHRILSFPHAKPSGAFCSDSMPGPVS
jgi:hypothetical protein